MTDKEEGHKAPKLSFSVDPEKLENKNCDYNAMGSLMLDTKS